MHVLVHSPRLHNAEPRFSVSARRIALRAVASAENTCISGTISGWARYLAAHDRKTGVPRAARKAPRRKRQCRSRSSRLSIVIPTIGDDCVGFQSERPLSRIDVAVAAAVLRFGLSKATSTYASRHLAPIPPSNCNPLTQLIIIQPDQVVHLY